MSKHFCISCQKDLPVEEFHKNKHKKTGLQDHCKKHQIKFAHSYYITNSKMILEKAKLRNKFKAGKINEKEYEDSLKKLRSN